MTDKDENSGSDEDPDRKGDRSPEEVEKNIVEQEEDILVTLGRAFGFIKKVPWEKMSIWTLFLILLYALRDFFSIILFTFIFSYIANTLVRFGERWVNRRKLLTVFVYVAFLALIIGPGSWFAERVIEQGRPITEDAGNFIQRMVEEEPANGNNGQGGTQGKKNGEGNNQKEERSGSNSTDPGSTEQTGKRTEEEKEGVDEGSNTSESLVGPEMPGGQKELPEGLRKKLENAFGKDTEEYDRIKQELREYVNGQVDGEREPVPLAGEEIPSHVRTLVNKILSRSLDSKKVSYFQQTDYYNRMLIEISKLWNQAIPYFTNKARVIFQNTLLYAFNILISLLFSFLIVFDIPRLKERIAKLGEGKLRDFYNEITPSLSSFGIVMGRSLQAQFLIAVVNTFLTWVGLYLINIPNLALLSVIVFLCSFVPVLGVIISTIPIGIVALATGGLIKLLIVVGLIVLIHTIETYILNPNIYGAHLKMHPLIVLIVLLVAEHFFGIWGLILGVPVSVYLLEVVVQNRTPQELFSGEVANESS